MSQLPPPVAILPPRTAQRLGWLAWLLALQVLTASFLLTRWMADLEHTPLARGVAAGYRVPGALLAAAVAPVEEEGRHRE